MSTPVITIPNYYDGYSPFVPYQVGPLRSYTDGVTRTRKYERDMRCLELVWEQSPFSTVGPIGGYLIAETQPRSCGAGEIEWTQTFAFLPPTRIVPETVTYPVQLIVNGSDLAELPITTVAQVTYEYFYDPSGKGVAPFRTYRLVKAGNIFFALGGPPPGIDGSLFVAQDSKVRPWAGFIVERATPRITWNSLAAVPS